MQRRSFLQSAALAALAPRLFAGARAAPKRVGLIGCGWYGKCDLFRLIQVTAKSNPVEVAALCDVDSQMLDKAASAVAERQASHKRPQTYGDFRTMLREQDFDIVLVGTPDHWHCLAMIEACRSGADVYVQKPISVDVIEGAAMVASARKYGRVVQVGTQRRSTPHLVEARDRFLREGRLGTIGLVEVYCYYHMRARANPPDADPPPHLDYDMWTGPAPLRPYNSLVHPRTWRAFMEYGNGIMGDMCIHMLDTVRWMAGLGWPTRISSAGGILVEKSSKANIPDTQTATFEFPQFPVVWQHRSYGTAPDPQYPWGATFYGDKGTLKVSVMGYDFIPSGGGEPIHRDVTYELDEYPEDKTEPDLEKHVAPANRAHMRDFLEAINQRESGRRPVADIEEGHISSASCILANLSMELGRTLAFDPATNSIPGDAEATARLRRAYRAPWKHPEPDQV